MVLARPLTSVNETWRWLLPGEYSEDPIVAYCATERGTLLGRFRWEDSTQTKASFQWEERNADNAVTPWNLKSSIPRAILFELNDLGQVWCAGKFTEEGLLRVKTKLSTTSEWYVCLPNGQWSEAAINGKELLLK